MSHLQSQPKSLRSMRWRRLARLDRDQQWKFMERVAEAGTLWFCNWNKHRMPELIDELRCSLMSGMTISDWINRHPKWFIFGEWDETRYAFPVQLTDAGRIALINRHLYDMEPVYGGLIEPGWQAIPLPK